MNSSNNREKAEKFADTAYSNALTTSARDFNTKYMELKVRVHRSGNSAGMLPGYAKLQGERIQQLAQARLDGLLEGYELYDVEIDDAAQKRILDEVVRLEEQLIASSSNSMNPEDLARIPAVGFQRFVRSECHFSPAQITIQIERRRVSQQKKEPVSGTVIHLHGHNSRVNVNSTDNSSNTVMMSSEQVFETLKQEIGSKVQDASKQAEILQKLAQLEQEQSSPTAFQRYSEFIAVAADHMTVLAPFIPALTEIVQKAFRF